MAVYTNQSIRFWIVVLQSPSSLWAGRSRKGSSSQRRPEHAERAAAARDGRNTSKGLARSWGRRQRCCPGTPRRMSRRCLCAAAPPRPVSPARSPPTRPAPAATGAPGELSDGARPGSRQAKRQDVGGSGGGAWPSSWTGAWREGARSAPPLGMESEALSACSLATGTGGSRGERIHSDVEGWS